MSFLFCPVFGAKITLSFEIKDIFDSFLSLFFSSEVFNFSCFLSTLKEYRFSTGVSLLFSDLSSFKVLGISSEISSFSFSDSS